MKYPLFDIVTRLIHIFRHIKGQLIERPLCISGSSVATAGPLFHAGEQIQYHPASEEETREGPWRWKQVRWAQQSASQALDYGLTGSEEVTWEKQKVRGIITHKADQRGEV
ncbi:hypothetical protein DSO57_1019714 [Entomophthora muscae]|uniref:Uncharacterized protein n=1 Tax=Entomophthora muscae TaxID=34485 RepID=A0ACC2SGR6_9FUNG|nr:hypothetical protein DSO57_1019714 [Entomophthora muscae]